MAKEFRPNWPTTQENVLAKQGGLTKGGLFCNAKCIFVFSLMTLGGYLLGNHEIFFKKFSLLRKLLIVKFHFIKEIINWKFHFIKESTCRHFLVYLEVGL